MITASVLREKRIPSEPGVYLMKDRDGRIIYIGKAKDLGKRVGLQQGLEIVGEGGAFVVQVAQLAGHPGDHAAERGGAGHDQGLGVQRCQDLGGQGPGQPRGPGPHDLGHPGDAEAAQCLRGGRGGGSRPARDGACSR